MDRSNQDSSDRVLTAVRLGWLIVEAYGRLRRYVQGGKRSPPEPDAKRRFSFSDRQLYSRDELLLTMDQLQHTATQLVPELTLKLPRTPEELARFLKDTDLGAAYGQFEAWSKQVWAILAVEDELVGRSFTFGGSLADTYWNVAGRRGQDRYKALSEMLDERRLVYTAARFGRIRDHLPAYVADVLHSTLSAWRIQAQLKDLDTKRKQYAVSRLEAQTQVWYDLLFSRRSAESYLTPGDHRQASQGALAATVILVLAVSVLAWLAVLVLARVGRSLLTTETPWRTLFTATRTGLGSQSFTWENLFALTATLSSVVVVLLGYVSRASGWIIHFHDRAWEWLKLRAIRRRAYRPWHKGGQAGE